MLQQTLQQLADVQLKPSRPLNSGEPLRPYSWSESLRGHRNWDGKTTQNDCSPTLPASFSRGHFKTEKNTQWAKRGLKAMLKGTAA